MAWLEAGLFSPSDLLGPIRALYAHIPFCRAKCAYCDFYSHPCLQGNDLEEYLEKLIAELIEAQAYLGAAAWGGIETVFIGGGTPSLLSAPQWESLLEAIGAATRPSEFTVECNPESLGPETLEVLAAGGVNRISLGVQSCEAAALKAAGRITTMADIERAFSLLHNRWRGRWNADFIAGLPEQSEAGLKADMGAAIEAGATHISLYALSLEPGTALYERSRQRGGAGSVPDEEARYELWDAGAAYLQDMGFTRYEISNFCVPGAECRHNLHYWNMDSYVGIGAGAASSLFFADGRSLRRMGLADSEVYSRAGAGVFPHETESISRIDGMKDFLLMGLRVSAGLEAGELVRRFGSDLARRLEPVFQRWEAQGALRRDTEPGALRIAQRISLTASGMDRENALLRECFEALEQGPA
jgi:oxygen-independent coproporphyrinogen-3 oxidase